MFGIGDRVEVIEHPDKRNLGKRGTVVFVGTGIKPVTQPGDVDLPKPEPEPRYDVALDKGKALHNLREQELRKL
jgi:hypothetical protein